MLLTDRANPTYQPTICRTGSKDMTRGLRTFPRSGQLRGELRAKVTGRVCESVSSSTVIRTHRLRRKGRAGWAAQSHYRRKSYA